MKVEETIVFQYAASPKLNKLLKSLESSLDVKSDFQAFYDAVFNIMSAFGWGLDVWGKILGIGRYITIEDTSGVFGFNGSGLEGWNQGTFYRDNSSGLFRLEDTAYRDLLLLKAMSNISNCSVPSLNSLLGIFFRERGRAYVKNAGVMAIRYVFEFSLEPYERALMRREDIPPRPAGVGYEVLEVIPESTFGFNGSGLHGWSQGVFSVGPYNPD